MSTNIVSARSLSLRQDRTLGKKRDKGFFDLYPEKEIPKQDTVWIQ